jgi:uncharacterized spore protein YtfJ
MTPVRPKEEDGMNIADMISQTRDALTVKRVFGEPYEKNGMTVIPVARVRGGAGGGSGEGPDGAGQGSGGGMGVMAGPVGVYVVKGDHLSWQPALDLNRVITGGQLVVVVLLLTIRSIVKARAKRSS